MTLTRFCVYTIKHATDLTKCLESSGRGSFRETTPWVTGYNLVDVARRQNERVAILFAPAERAGGVFLWGLLTNVEIAGLQTRYSFSDLRSLKPEIDKVSLSLRNGRKLSKDYIRPYAICRTPDRLLKNAS